MRIWGDKGKCFGFLVDERGIEANPDKIKAIMDMKSPSSVKEVQRLTGCIAALSRFMSKFADKCSPFFKTLKQARFEWTKEADDSFNQLKEYLASLPKLVSPRDGETLVLYVSISEYSLSGVLIAERERNQLPVYYVSHAYRGSEGNYTEAEKVLFAVVMASRKLKPYFQSHQIVVRSNQPLRKILEGKNQSSRVSDWANQLADFGIEYEPRRAIKAQALADFIVETTTPIPSEPNQEWKLYVDGSSTKSSSGAGLLIISSVGVRMERAVRFEFAASNNEAEYEALLLGLKICYEAGAKSLSVFSDSQLIVGQVRGEFEAKDESMKMYLQQVKELLEKFEHFTLSHIPRSENAQADSLARLASSAETSAARDIVWEVLPNPSINFMVHPIDRSESWMEPYIQYLQHHILPQDPVQAEALQKKVKWFELHEGTLYKKSYTHPLLKCVTSEEGNYIIREIHEGGCGIHQGVRTVINKILRNGYYWPSLRQDTEKVIKHCSKCQYFSKLDRKPTNYHSCIQAVLLFDKWGMDLLGPFPPAKGQKKFIIVAIDYFSKYVEAEALSTITDKQVCQFIWRNIITRYGVPRVIITDNGRQFISKHTAEYCNKFNIHIRFSSVSRPQTNGQVESANKEILNGIKKKIEGAKGAWDEELPGVLWATRTTVKESTGHTPFSLVYGSEAVLPVEIGIPSTRITFYDHDDNAAAKRVNLDLLPETRGNALLRSIAQKQRMARQFNRHVKTKTLKEGDYVLRKVEATGKIVEKGKLGANWDGPFKITRTVVPGTFELEDMKGKKLQRPWNGDHLKKFFI
jgi:ribonuclease HI